MDGLLKRIWSPQSVPPEEGAASASDEPTAEASNAGHVEMTAAAGAPPAKQSPPPAPSGLPMKRPSKRATASEMRGDLARLGLDTKGKRETLFK